VWKVPQYLRAGGKQACLGVGTEQVVLDLVVKAAKGGVGEQTAADVA
jgi:hypothetical protein